MLHRIRHEGTEGQSVSAPSFSTGRSCNRKAPNEKDQNVDKDLNLEGERNRREEEKKREKKKSLKRRGGEKVKTGTSITGPISSIKNIRSGAGIKNEL